MLSEQQMEKESGLNRRKTLKTSTLKIMSLFYFKMHHQGLKDLILVKSHAGNIGERIAEKQACLNHRSLPSDLAMCQQFFLPSKACSVSLENCKEESFFNLAHHIQLPLVSLTGSPEASFHLQSKPVSLEKDLKLRQTKHKTERLVLPLAPSLPGSRDQSPTGGWKWWDLGINMTGLMKLCFGWSFSDRTSSQQVNCSSRPAWSNDGASGGSGTRAQVDAVIVALLYHVPVPELVRRHLGGSVETKPGVQLPHHTPSPHPACAP